MDGFSRRDFIRTAGAATGVAIATGYDPLAYAKNDKRIRIGCIGTGGQGSFHLGDGIWDCDEIEVVAVADVYKHHQKGGILRG